MRVLAVVALTCSLAVLAATAVQAKPTKGAKSTRLPHGAGRVEKRYPVDWHARYVRKHGHVQRMLRTRRLQARRRLLDAPHGIAYVQASGRGCRPDREQPLTDTAPPVFTGGAMIRAVPSSARV